MTDIEITKTRLRAIRMAAGLTDDMVKYEYKGEPQAPRGTYESDYRYSKFARHHFLRA